MTNLDNFYGVHKLNRFQVIEQKRISCFGFLWPWPTDPKSVVIIYRPWPTKTLIMGVHKLNRFQVIERIRILSSRSLWPWLLTQKSIGIIYGQWPSMIPRKVYMYLLGKISLKPPWIKLVVRAVNSHFKYRGFDPHQERQTLCDDCAKCGSVVLADCKLVLVSPGTLVSGLTAMINVIIVKQNNINVNNTSFIFRLALLRIWYENSNVLNSLVMSRYATIDYVCLLPCSSFFHSRRNKETPWIKVTSGLSVYIQEC